MICGYSLPDYDVPVKDLLKSSVGKVKRIVVLDINPKPIIDKLHDIFNNLSYPEDILPGPGITSELNMKDVVSRIFTN